MIRSTSRRPASPVIRSAKLSRLNGAARRRRRRGVQDRVPRRIVDRDAQMQRGAVGGRGLGAPDRVGDAVGQAVATADRGEADAVAHQGGDLVGEVEPQQPHQRGDLACGRRQLSLENAKSVSVPTPWSGAASTMRRIASTPASWPRGRDRPRRVAQRPLPSMMMPTCSRAAASPLECDVTLHYKVSGQKNEMIKSGWIPSRRGRAVVLAGGLLGGARSLASRTSCSSTAR